MPNLPGDGVLPQPPPQPCWAPPRLTSLCQLHPPLCQVPSALRAITWACCGHTLGGLHAPFGCPGTVASSAGSVGGAMRALGRALALANWLMATIPPGSFAAWQRLLRVPRQPRLLQLGVVAGWAGEMVPRDAQRGLKVGQHPAAHPQAPIAVRHGAEASWGRLWLGKGRWVVPVHERGRWFWSPQSCWRAGLEALVQETLVFRLRGPAWPRDKISGMGLWAHPGTPTAPHRARLQEEEGVAGTGGGGAGMGSWQR